MSLSDQDREKIQEKEIARWRIREELKRQKRPRRFVIAAIWALALTALAAVFAGVRP